MKRGQYILHEVSMRNTSEVMNLFEKEEMMGYGIYWALMEYLRVQDDYVGDIRSLSTLKRELRIRQSRLDKVLHGYGLFVCNGNTFYSPKLNEVMKPFEQRRARIEAYKLQKQKENSLKISGEAPEKSGVVSFEGKGKGEGKGEGTTTSNKEDDGGDGASVPTVLAWERYVNELQKPIDKGKYKHEDVDPATGQRSYCGVPILSDAPPRPNVQAVWCEGKWVY